MQDVYTVKALNSQCITKSDCTSNITCDLLLLPVFSPPPVFFISLPPVLLSPHPIFFSQVFLFSPPSVFFSPVFLTSFPLFCFSPTPPVFFCLFLSSSCLLLLSSHLLLSSSSLSYFSCKYHR